MRKGTCFVFFPIIILIAAAATVAAANWVFLGERTVTDRLDHDTIVVGSDRGEFSKLKVMVKVHAVDFHRFVIHFGNDQTQEVEGRRTIPAGGETRAIDLAGGRRVIKRIDFWYDAHTLGGKEALVEVFGLR